MWKSHAAGGPWANFVTKISRTISTWSSMESMVMLLLSARRRFRDLNMVLLQVVEAPTKLCKLQPTSLGKCQDQNNIMSLSPSLPLLSLCLLSLRRVARVSKSRANHPAVRRIGRLSKSRAPYLPLSFFVYLSSFSPSLLLSLLNKKTRQEDFRGTKTLDCATVEMGRKPP